MRFTKQYRHSNSPTGKHQIQLLVEVVDRLLFASAPSLEEYVDPSSLDNRIRYIAARVLLRKLQNEGLRRKLADEKGRALSPSRIRESLKTIDRAQRTTTTAKATATATATESKKSDVYV